MTCFEHPYATHFRQAAHRAMFGVTLGGQDAHQLVEALAKRLRGEFKGLCEADTHDAIGETLRRVEENVRGLGWMRFHRVPETGEPAGPEHLTRTDLVLDHDHVRAYVWIGLRGWCKNALTARRPSEIPAGYASRELSPPDWMEIRIRLQEAMEQARRTLELERREERERLDYDAVMNWIKACESPSDQSILLGYIEGMSERDIAARAKVFVAPGNVRQRKHRLVAALESEDPALAGSYRELCERERRRQLRRR